MAHTPEDDDAIGVALHEIERLHGVNGRVRAERDSWRNALMSLTPGGSEYTTPEACVAAVRERFDGLHARTVDSHRERNRLRAEVAELVAFAELVAEHFAHTRLPLGIAARAVLAKHQPKETKP